MCKKVLTFAVASLLCVTVAGQKNTQLPAVQKNADVAGDTLHLVGHAHMDMNWLWTLSETQKMANDNLRQAVAFMKEYPDYHLLQSEAAAIVWLKPPTPMPALMFT